MEKLKYFWGSKEVSVVWDGKQHYFYSIGSKRCHVRSCRRQCQFVRGQLEHPQHNHEPVNSFLKTISLRAYQIVQREVLEVPEKSFNEYTKKRCKKKNYVTPKSKNKACDNTADAASPDRSINAQNESNDSFSVKSTGTAHESPSDAHHSPISELDDSSSDSFNSFSNAPSSEISYVADSMSTPDGAGGSSNTIMKDKAAIDLNTGSCSFNRNRQHIGWKIQPQDYGIPSRLLATIAPPVISVGSCDNDEPIVIRIFPENSKLALMDQVDAAGSKTAASGVSIQSVLQAFQHRKTNTKESSGKSEEKFDKVDDRPSASLLDTPKKKLSERWEQVSPSVKSTLERYSPRRLKGWFSDTSADERGNAENGSESMEPGYTVSPAQMVAERKSRYARIAEFCLGDSTNSSCPTRTPASAPVPCSADAVDASGYSSTVFISYETWKKFPIERNALHRTLEEPTSGRSPSLQKAQSFQNVSEKIPQNFAKNKKNWVASQETVLEESAPSPLKVGDFKARASSICQINLDKDVTVKLQAVHTDATKVDKESESTQFKTPRESSKDEVATTIAISSDVLETTFPALLVNVSSPLESTPIACEKILETEFPIAETLIEKPDHLAEDHSERNRTEDITATQEASQQPGRSNQKELGEAYIIFGDLHSLLEEEKISEETNIHNSFPPRRPLQSEVFGLEHDVKTSSQHHVNNAKETEDRVVIKSTQEKSTEAQSKQTPDNRIVKETDKPLVAQAKPQTDSSDIVKSTPEKSLKTQLGVKMPAGPPHIVLSEGAERPMTLFPPPATPDGQLHRKSPVTVQEWVDHLPHKPNPPPPEVRTEEPPIVIESAALLRCQAASRLSREPSVQSSSSLDSLLDSRRPDPVEVLLNLGFGGVPGIDLDNCRIPKRFLVPSKCKGGDWDEFLRRELIQAQNFECTSLGFRGLSGPSHQRPSAIVANIMEKLREQTAPRPPPRIANRFTSVAKRVLSETSVLSRLTNHSASTSVLTPDNRKFLESQGKISPEVPRRRIIFGEKSFAINKDGELVDDEPSPSKSTTAAPSAGSWSVGSGMSGNGDADVDSEENRYESDVAVTTADLLRMRRTSLQRQRCIEADDGAQDGPAVPHRFDVVDEDGEDLRDALAAEIETLSRRIQSAPPEELVAILRPIKELKGKLTEL